MSSQNSSNPLQTSSSPVADLGLADIGEYVRRIGYSGELSPSLQTLRALHEAHVGSIPFENLDPLLGQPGRLDIASLFAKLVYKRRGGYCYEQNSLFKHVLEAIGFRVRGLAARVRFGSAVVRPRTHMLLLVETEGRNYIADVGFGGIGLLEPISLIAGCEFSFPLVSFRLIQQDAGWLLQATYQGQWTDLYIFTLEPQEPPDYEMAHYFSSTHPQSIFVLGLTAQLVKRHERILLRNRTIQFLRSDGDESRELLAEADVLSALREHFHLELPTGSSLPDQLFK